MGKITRGLTDWAVPFFFVVSGFWFARGAFMQVFGKSDVSTFLIMLLMPWANLAFCLAAAHAARRFAPRMPRVASRRASTRS